MYITRAEKAVVARQLRYWQELIEAGVAIVAGPVADPAGAWALAIVKAEAEADVRTLGVEDPAVKAGIATFKVYAMPDAMVGS